MNAVSVDISSILVSEGSFVAGTNLFISNFPEGANKALCIYDTSSSPPEGTVDGESTWVRESIMIKVRNSSYPAVYQDAVSIISLLHNRSNQTINGTKYMYMSLLNGPTSLGEVIADIYELTMNFSILRAW